MAKQKKVTPTPSSITTRKAAGATPLASMATITYTTKGGAKYSPRVSHTAEAWEKLQKEMGIKGQATHAALCKVLETHFTKSDENHHDFISYMVRRKAISIMA